MSHRKGIKLWQQPKSMPLTSTPMCVMARIGKTARQLSVCSPGYGREQRTEGAIFSEVEVGAGCGLKPSYDKPLGVEVSHLLPPRDMP